MKLGKIENLIKWIEKGIDEEVVYAKYVLKINRKNQEDSRYLVCSENSLYLCSYMIVRYKICRKYPLISIQNIEKVDDYLLFSFNGSFSKPEFKIKNEEIGPLIRYLKDFLPLHLGKMYKFLDNFKERKDSQKKRTNGGISSQISNIYVSLCHSKNVEVNTDLRTLLESSARRRYVMIDTDEFIKIENKDSDTIEGQLSLESNIIFYSLKYCRHIKDLRLGGNTLPFFLSFLADIIKVNPNFEHLTIFDNVISDEKHFRTFLHSVKNSNIKSFEIKDVSFSFDADGVLEDMFSVFSRNKRKAEMYFTRCGDPDMFSRALSKLETESGFDLLTFTGMQFKDMSAILDYVIRSSLTTFCLKDCGIDVGSFFEIFNAENGKDYIRDIPLMTLDLSHNFCSESFNFPVVFPKNLYKLRLQKCTWKGKSFLNLIFNTKFSLSAKLKLASSTFEDIDSSYYTKNISVMISDIKWCKNMLTQHSLELFSKLTFLKKLDISDCTVKDDHILDCITEFLKKVDLDKFKVNGTFVEDGVRMMRCLSPVIKNYKKSEMEDLSETSKEQDIFILDISENKIGDEGLTILSDILNENRHIRVKFDGSCPSQKGLDKFYEDTKGKPTCYIQPKQDIKRLLERGYKPIMAEKEDESCESATFLNSEKSIKWEAGKIRKFTCDDSVNWDFDMDKCWEDLRAEFSFDNLTKLSLSNTMSSNT